MVKDKMESHIVASISYPLHQRLDKKANGVSSSPDDLDCSFVAGSS